MRSQMDDRDAGPALLQWLTAHLPAAEVADLAALLRSCRRTSFRRRRAARRAFIAAFCSRLPPAARPEAAEALAWLLGERWLPPPVDELPSPRPSARPLL